MDLPSYIHDVAHPRSLLEHGVEYLSEEERKGEIPGLACRALSRFP